MQLLVQARKNASKGPKRAKMRENWKRRQKSAYFFAFEQFLRFYRLDIVGRIRDTYSRQFKSIKMAPF